MNSDSTNLSPDELDLRLTSLALGELPTEEAEQLRAMIERNPELRLAFEQRKRTAELVASAAAAHAHVPANAPMRLSSERREKLMASFAAKPFQPTPAEGKREPRSLWYVPLSLAALLIGLLGLSVSMIGGFLPWGRAKARAQAHYARVDLGAMAKDGPDLIDRESSALSKAAREPAAAEARIYRYAATPLPGLAPSVRNPEPANRGETVAAPSVIPSPSEAPARPAGNRAYYARTTIGKNNEPASDRAGAAPADNLGAVTYNAVSGGALDGFAQATPSPAPEARPATPPASLTLGDTLLNFQSPIAASDPVLDSASNRKFAESFDSEVKAKINQADTDANWRWAEPGASAPIPAQKPAAKAELAESKEAATDYLKVQTESLMELEQIDKQLAKRAGIAGMSTPRGGTANFFDDLADKKQSVTQPTTGNESLFGSGGSQSQFGRRSGGLDGGQFGGGFGGAASSLGQPGPVDQNGALTVAQNGQVRLQMDGVGKDTLSRQSLARNLTTGLKSIDELSGVNRSLGNAVPTLQAPSDGRKAEAAQKGVAEDSIQTGAINGPAASTAVSLGVQIQSSHAEKPKQEKRDEKLLEERSKSLAEIDAPSAPRPAVALPVPQPEVLTRENTFSTFSLNVADVSFKLAASSLERGAMPDGATIRSEEFINAFDYRDPQPAPGMPIAFASEQARYPFAHNRDVLRLSVKTAAQGREAGKPLNVVILLDNSGSMERADRVRIIQECLRTLASQFKPQDKLSVVTFARTARLWIDGVSGTNAAAIAEQVGALTPEGGTNLEDALDLAYKTASRHQQAQSVSRVVLLTDGAANLGNVDPQSLKAKVENYRKQGVALDSFGVGWEGYNDDLLETLTRNGDGRYGFINTPEEAGPQFAAQLAGALRVAASDVKVQVEFNPKRVTAWRQVGYAKHQLTKEQFRDNTVDAAEIGAAEAGNAVYVIETKALGEGPIATVRVRYKDPGTSDYHEREWQVPASVLAPAIEQASPATRLASAAAGFSEWLAGSPFAGEVTTDRLLGIMAGVPDQFGSDPRPKRLEWMIRQAKSISGK